MLTESVYVVECVCGLKYQTPAVNIQCKCGKILVIQWLDARKPQPAPTPINEKRESAA